MGLAGLLSAGALAAYAAQPGAPERLPAQAAGVVGSGDQLSLRVAQDGQERTIRPGDDYAEGWKLDALTPASATLVKDGERRQVGLNPTGALASSAPAAAPSQVQVQQSDAELLAYVLEHNIWDGRTTLPGLSLAETERYQLLHWKGFKLAGAIPPSPPLPLGGAREITGSMIAAALGPDSGEFNALVNRQSQAVYDQAVTAFQRFGPVEVPLPTAGDREADAALKAAYPGARWTVRQGANGGPVMVIVMPSPQSAPGAARP